MDGKAMLMLACLFAIARAEVIDRIAVTVGNQVITQSEIDREIRLTAFLNREQPDFDPATRRKAADRLVEQKLVRREQQLSRYPTPQPSEADPLFREIEARYQDRAALDQSLRQYGLAEADLREHLLWQLTLLRFIDVRFRPGIQISDEEIRQYYKQHLKPADGGIEQFRDRIEQALTQQRVDQELEQWLQRARQRTKVEYKKGVLE